jgi:hypothetical protein
MISGRSRLWREQRRIVAEFLSAGTPADVITTASRGGRAVVAG